MMTEYAIRPIGTPLGPEDAASKYYECINWMCAEVERLSREREELESKLNNITCIVAEMRESMKDYVISWVDADGLWSETKTSIPYERVNKLLADLTHALKAKGRLLRGNDLGQNLEGTPQECPKPSNGLAFNALGVLVPSTTAKTEGREISTAQFPAYAVLLHVNDEYAGTDYWDVHHIEPVAGDEPGAALKAYKAAEKNLLACRKHINSAKAYLVCLNLIAGPDTDLSDLEGGNPNET